MKIMHLFFSMIIFSLGFFIGVRVFSDSDEIVFGQETRISRIIANSALHGLSAIFIAFGGINFLVSIDKSYQFDIMVLISFLTISFGFGLVVFFGVLWRYFQVGIYRNFLLDYLRNRGRNKKP